MTGLLAILDGKDLGLRVDISNEALIGTIGVLQHVLHAGYIFLPYHLVIVIPIKTCQNQTGSCLYWEGERFIRLLKKDEN